MSSVVLIELWPSRDWMALACTPAAMRRANGLALIRSPAGVCHLGSDPR